VTLELPPPEPVTPPPRPRVKRIGVCVSPAPLTVDLAGVIVPVQATSSCAPVPGDRVVVLQEDGDLIALAVVGVVAGPRGVFSGSNGVGGPLPVGVSAIPLPVAYDPHGMHAAASSVVTLLWDGTYSAHGHIPVNPGGGNAWVGVAVDSGASWLGIHGCDANARNVSIRTVEGFYPAGTTLQLAVLLQTSAGSFSAGFGRQSELKVYWHGAAAP
jgi:hypothetical protein